MVGVVGEGMNDRSRNELGFIGDHESAAIDMARHAAQSRTRDHPRRTSELTYCPARGSVRASINEEPDTCSTP